MILKSIKEIIRSISHACRGVIFVYKGEKNFRRELWLGVVFLSISFFLDMSYLERSLVLFFVTLPLSLEMINTAIEYSWNKLHPDIHDSVGKIKDISAGAVLLTGIISYAVIIILFVSNI
jgi:diacylglycerol kinase